jgi:myo-inositol-1(or 4)-monophosphatase
MLEPLLMKSAPAIDLCLIREWLRKAGDIALSHRHRVEVDIKDDGTPSTAADREIEAFLLDNISKRYPNHKIITEEGGTTTGNQEFVWVIDPLDGTRAFASGLPIWGTSIGVLRRGQPYLGAFSMPALGEMYWGSSIGAFCNDSPILRRSSVSIENPLAFMVVPSNAHQIYEIGFPRIRSLGSTAAHLIYVARGSAVGALTRRVKIWDVAGVLPILRQTGITLVYFSGRSFHIRDLLSGQSAAEPLVAAHFSLIERVRTSFQVKQR